MSAFVDIQQRLLDGLSELSTRLPAILSEPRAYPRESMLLAAVASLILVLIVLLVVVVVDVIRARARRRSLGVARRRRWLPLGVVVASLLLAGVLIALAPMVPAAGSACGTCHEIGEAVEAWRVDAHAGESCYACHSLGGVSGALHAASRGAARVFAVSSAVSVYGSRCEECHDEIRGGVVGSVVRMRHIDVIEAGFGCVECHPRVGHASLGAPENRIDRSRMGVCLTCHDGVSASSDCGLCHDGSPSDRTDGQLVANTPAPVTCSGCHTAQTERGCIECHGLELPHPAPFRGEHAGRSWNDPDLCIKCHPEGASERGCGCHSDVNVHGTYTDWFPRHGPQARIAWPGGCNCHGANFCAMCHQTSPL